ncbi:MAG: hypothetical protein M3A44_15035 [Gammaproteobacteria bacterium]
MNRVKSTKRLLFLLALLFGALSRSIAAEPAVPASFVADATTGISRAAFDTIKRYYKRGFPPGELTPSKEYPVRIAFSESDAKDVTLEHTYKSATVSGTASITAKKIELAVDDTDPAANKERAKDPNVWVEIVAGRLRVKSGKYECAGTFLANGKKIVIISGDAEITGLDGLVTFSTGAQVVVDGQNFSYLQGKWVASAAASSDTKR